MGEVGSYTGNVLLPLLNTGSCSDCGTPAATLFSSSPLLLLLCYTLARFILIIFRLLVLKRQEI
jgi:hypothetical protein